MKKIISLIFVLTLVLIMSGCIKESDYEKCIDAGGTIILNNIHNGKECIQITTYSQKEVDLMLQDLCEDIFGYEENCISLHKDVQAIFEELDTELYTMSERRSKLNERVCELESMLRDFERFEYEDLIEFEEYFYGEWIDELENYILELEARIVELELN